MTRSELATAVRSDLHAAADPDLAPGMAAYMKVEENGSLPFLGVRRPAVRAIARGRAREHTDPDALLAAVRTLWDEARTHEEQYAAQDLLGLRWARGRLDLLDLHRDQIVTGAWWDHVDESAHRVEDLLVTHPDAVRPVLLVWSTDPDRWLRRVAIIAQLHRKEQVDLDLLAAVIAPNLADPDFFVRKAIGWSLRQVSRWNPGWVLAYADSHDLSPLSRREALKHVL